MSYNRLSYNRLSWFSTTRQNTSNEIYLSNSETSRRTLVFIIIRSVHELIIYFPICKVIWRISRKMIFTKIHITRSDDEYSKNNKTMQRRGARNIEYRGGAAVSREAPARSHNGKRIQRYWRNWQEETCVAMFCTIRERCCAASTKGEEEAVKVPGSIPRAATKKWCFTPSPCDLDWGI